jgi:HEPN domain-containing protein
LTKSRRFKKEYSKELLSIAEEDLKTAKVLLDAKIRRKENTLFHIEQTIEKSLKAVLCQLEIPVPLSHELSILVDRLPKGIEPPMAEDLFDLTQFATIRRYEEGRADFSDEEMVTAFRLARGVLNWAKKVK